MDNRSERLAANYQRLYHVAEAGSVESIRKHGLLSTTAILDRCAVTGEARLEIESQVRPRAIDLMLGPDRVTIRDQKPMNEAALHRILDGCSPQEWCEMLNRHVFFWLTRKRLQDLLGAKEYREREHDVVIVNTRRLLLQHGDRVRLTPMNTGATLYNAPRRGLTTFAAIADFPLEERLSRLEVAGAVAELAVEYSVPDIADYIMDTERWVGPNKKQ